MRPAESENDYRRTAALHTTTPELQGNLLMWKNELKVAKIKLVNFLS